MRGNSGSGKSTTARQLRARLGRGTAIVEQQHVFDEHQEMEAVLGRILVDLGLPADLPADPEAVSFGR
nr:hypothetical protein [Kribbella italica]